MTQSSSLEPPTLAPGTGVPELNALLTQVPFLKHYGFAVQSCATGMCVLYAPFHPDLERPGGIISGLTFMGAADVAMWLAIMTLRGTSEQWVTTDMKTAFLRSARRDDVLCTAQVLKLGRKTVYGTAHCRSAKTDELLTHHTLTYAYVAALQPNATTHTA